MRTSVENTSNTSLERDRMFREIFSREIYPRYFEHLKQPDADPDVYFIGGQPGSGKSVRERVLYNDLNRNNPGTVTEINGDDFRAFHPDYYRLLTEDDATAASKIDQDNKFFYRIMHKDVCRERRACYFRGNFSPTKRRTINC